MNKNIIIYSTHYCPYCVRAKRFFESCGVRYQEIDVTNDDQQLRRLKAETGHMTVPLIFVDGVFIGGYTDLMEKVDAGDLKF